MHVPRVAIACALAVSVVAMPGRGAAQQCAVVKSNPNGSFTVDIGGVPHVAFADSALRKIMALRDDLETERQVNARLKEMVAVHQEEVEQLQRLVTAARALIQTQEEQLQAREREVRLLNRLKQGGWLTVELGAGATGGENRPALLAGVAVRRLRIWGLLQESNGGGFLGVSFPLF